MDQAIQILLNIIAVRQPLQEYSTAYKQPIGLVEVTKVNPRRPPTGVKWWSDGSSDYVTIKLPIWATGKRIAVIDEANKTLEALTVGQYQQRDGATIAVVPRGSNLVWLQQVDSERVIATVHQISYDLEVRLAGRKVVGLTRHELSTLRDYATRSQNL